MIASYGAGARTAARRACLAHALSWSITVLHFNGGACARDEVTVSGMLPTQRCPSIMTLVALLLWAVPAACTAISEGPCDILEAAGNPCVAAHSTVRALFAKYDGPLYTVFHNHSGKSVDIHTLSPGGFANVTQHEAICPAAGECVIARVVDQSGKGNHLTPRDDRGVPQRAPAGAPPRFGHLHNPVDASTHKLHVGEDSDTEVYGMYFDPGMGYNNNDTKGVATGDGECAAVRYVDSLLRVRFLTQNATIRPRDNVRRDDRQAMGQHVLL